MAATPFATSANRYARGVVRGQIAACRFAANMVHVKGQAWAGRRLTLKPWQCFLLASAFGWVRQADGRRRFRRLYAEIPRKSGKSMLGATIGELPEDAAHDLGLDHVDPALAPGLALLHTAPRAMVRAPSPIILDPFPGRPR